MHPFPQVRWAQENDAAARRVARAGQRHAKRYLSAERAGAYQAETLREYALHSVR